MNPEFLRNLWLEATPFRLGLIAGLLLLVFTASTIAPHGLASTSGVAQALYWFLVVLWGTRSAALSVVGEIRERTWDGQKLSSIGPAEMAWGKLFGATIANWFGGVLCLPFILAPVWIAHGPGACITYAVLLLILGVLAQAVALLASLNLIRRNTGNWRLDTFLCQVAGILAAFLFYKSWSLLAGFERSVSPDLQWWNLTVSLRNFDLISLALFTGWALVGCYRAMRAELRFANGPFVWLAWLLFLCVYEAGFGGWFAGHLPDSLGGANPALQDSAARLAIAAFAVLCTAYGMVFLEPKDPVRLRWLGEQVRAGRLGKAFLALDAWMLSTLAAMAVTLILALVLARDGAELGGQPASAYAPAALALLGFFTRDMALFVLMRSFARGRGDFAALAALAALYMLLPLIFSAGRSTAIAFLFFPVPGNWIGVAWAWVQGVAVAAWALRRLQRG